MADDLDYNRLAGPPSEFDFDPRERRRHRMMAAGMPDPNLSWGGFNRQAFGNFGQQALGMIPGVNAGIDSYNAYQEDRPIMAGVHAARGVAELALPSMMGRYAQRTVDRAPGRSSQSGQNLFEGSLSGWGLPNVVNGPGLYGIQPSQSTMRSAAPESLPGNPLAGRTIEETTALLRQRAREIMDQSQRDYYTQQAARATGHEPRSGGGAWEDIAAARAATPVQRTPEQDAVRASLEGVRPRQLERDGKLVIQNEPSGVGNGPSEGLTPEYLRAIREFWRMQRPDHLNSLAGAGAAGGLAAYLQDQPEGPY